jgi:hypothetical protein
LGVWQGGNVNLKPEKTDAYTAGIVWTPKFLPGFTMTMDWYQLFTTDLILSPADQAQVLLSEGVVDTDGCGNGSNNAECPGRNTTNDGIGRDAAGNLQWVDADFGNAGSRFVQGLGIAFFFLPLNQIMLSGIPPSGLASRITQQNVAR